MSHWYFIYCDHTVDKHPIQGRVAILLVVSCYRQHMICLCGPPVACVQLFLTLLHVFLTSITKTCWYYKMQQMSSLPLNTKIHWATRPDKHVPYLSSLKYTGATRRCSWYNSVLTRAHTAAKKKTWQNSEIILS